MSIEQQKQRWPFDPMQPGDHEPVRIPDDHPSKQEQRSEQEQQQRPDPKPK